MKVKTYQQLAGRTDSGKQRKLDAVRYHLLHASLGMNTEQAEFADALKRYMFYGTEIDRINLLEELGDSLWYIALALNTLESSFEICMEGNIAKLQNRYPEKFDDVLAVVRDLTSEREILDKILYPVVLNK
jgi:NTP pyrophosphatase (non-canonical NTP hydrolase)